MEKYAVMLFLGLGSITDVRKKEIPGVLLAGFALVGIAVQLWKIFAKVPADGAMEISAVGWIAGGVAGILLAVASRLTGGGIGYGDAFAASVTGIWLGLVSMMEIFFLGLCLASVYSAWLFLVRNKERKYRIAFLPFLMGGCLIWLLLEGKWAGG